jgi:hypothetical protein
MLPVSLDCPFLIATVFSNAHLAMFLLSQASKWDFNLGGQIPPTPKICCNMTQQKISKVGFPERGKY